ncbi:MAG TPA: hypothetical protein VHE35_01845 [Kofleriaceae bacterium]|nr:hypothetical protein [Kofleriaceae bacterium]
MRLAYGGHTAIDPIVTPSLYHTELDFRTGIVRTNNLFVGAALALGVGVGIGYGLTRTHRARRRR